MVVLAIMGQGNRLGLCCHRLVALGLRCHRLVALVLLLPLVVVRMVVDSR